MCLTQERQNSSFRVDICNLISLVTQGSYYSSTLMCQDLFDTHCLQQDILSSKRGTRIQ